MSHCRKLYRLAVAVLATTCLTVPSAFAMPADPTGAAKEDPRQLDMHASTVTPPAAHADLRTPDAIDQSRAPEPVSPPPGMPTWPENPQPLTPPSAPAAATDGGGDGGGAGWTVPAIVLGACLLLGGALLVGRSRLRAAT